MTLPKNTRRSRSVLPSTEPRSASAPPPLENLGHLPVKPRWTHNQQSKLLREATKSKYSITSGGPQEADDTKESFESVARAVIPKWFKQSEVAAGEEAQCQYNTLRGMYSDGRARFRQGDNELEYYIGADGPDDSTNKHAMDLWKQVCAECPLFPLMHELFYNHPKPAPSRCTPPHQPTDESSTNTKYIIFDRCHQRQIACLELEYNITAFKMEMEQLHHLRTVWPNGMPLQVFLEHENDIRQTYGKFAFNNTSANESSSWPSTMSTLPLPSTSATLPQDTGLTNFLKDFSAMDSEFASVF